MTAITIADARKLKQLPDEEVRDIINAIIAKATEAARDADNILSAWEKHNKEMKTLGEEQVAALEKETEVYEEMAREEEKPSRLLWLLIGAGLAS